MYAYACVRMVNVFGLESDKVNHIELCTKYPVRMGKMQLKANPTRFLSNSRVAVTHVLRDDHNGALRYISAKIQRLRQPEIPTTWGRVQKRHHKNRMITFQTLKSLKGV